MCWKSASLLLEVFIWQPDLHIWINLIRCLLRLIRFGAIEVADALTQQLRELRNYLPLNAPHRRFVFAFTDVSLNQLASGAVFLMEAFLRNVQILWPKNLLAHSIYQQMLAEERFYAGFHDHSIGLENKALSSKFFESTPQSISDYADISAALISHHMLLFDYDNVEVLTRKSIADIQRLVKEDGEKGIYQVLLSTHYSMLGNAQYYKQDFESSKDSYVKSLKIHRDYLDRHKMVALEYPSAHRILTLLEWIDGDRLNNKQTHFNDYVSQQKAIERNLTIRLAESVERPLKRGQNYSCQPHNRFGLHRHLRRSAIGRWFPHDIVWPTEGTHIEGQLGTRYSTGATSIVGATPRGTITDVPDTMFLSSCYGTNSSPSSNIPMTANVLSEADASVSLEGQSPCTHGCAVTSAAILRDAFTVGANVDNVPSFAGLDVEKSPLDHNRVRSRNLSSLTYVHYENFIAQSHTPSDKFEITTTTPSDNTLGVRVSR